MASVGFLSSVNLIAGAGILGNVGGVAFLPANTGLTANINSYTSVNVVNQFLNIVNTGYITVNVGASSFPALTDAIPIAYQSNLGDASMTGTILTEAYNITGNGDLGKFEQVFAGSYGFVGSTNELIKSSLNANSASYKTGYINQDNIITGGLSTWSLAFIPLSQDLAQLGYLINLDNLNNLGSPAALLKQIYSLVGPIPALSDTLTASGISQDKVDSLSTSTFTDAEQKIMYNVMTLITGNTLEQVLKALKVTTVGLSTMADLLNPIKIFPRSYITFTTTTNNGIRAVYLDNAGTINSLLAVELPAGVLGPLNGNPQPNLTTYNQLKKIIPPDQALGNKAIQVALGQIKTIFNTSLSQLASATAGLETNKGLNIINELTEPLPANVAEFYKDTYAHGTGPDGLLYLADVIGTPSGWIHSPALVNTVTVLNQMTTAGAFGNLTNGSNGVYTVMAGTAAGNYTTFDIIGNVYNTVIPPGLPGSGSYTGNTSSESIQSAFDSGLTPNLVSNISIIVSAYSNSVSETTGYFNDMANQLQLEQINLSKAGISFANLVAGITPTGLVTSLSNYGVDTTKGGAAYILESIANIQNQAGQAVISTMREARNQVRLSNAGIDTVITVSSQYPEPQANLSSGSYTVSEATSQKII